MRLPPYGKRFQPMPRNGVRVAIGPGAWDKARRTSQDNYPLMVLPEGEDAASFRWPSDGGPALVFETGQPDDMMLAGLARELLLAGASSVVAIREAYSDFHDSRDPRVFFDRDSKNVAS